MVICSYVVITAPGSAETLALRIAAMSTCEVVRASNRDVLLVVTETEDATQDAALRETLAALPGVTTLALTFGEVAAGTEQQAAGS